MSQPRSGLLSGLVVGFVATLICAIAQAAALLYGDRFIPAAFLTAGDGLWAMTTIAFAAALLLSLLVCLFRPGSRLLPWWSALCAVAAVALGWATARAASTGGRPDLSLDRLVTNFPAELTSLWPSLKDSWEPWLPLAVAALTAYFLVRVRVGRVRARRASLTPPEDDPTPAEPEYRAPFEPLQSPTNPSRPTGDLFTPRDSGRA
ncbi:hypothetical protein [Nonomuraea aurantiaca]|uniref:hypothetical protein n=1 Tax=Nonomuraea aurantiaca TaxID=2878562 RepID=UPI001CD99FEA|nr:hypothetical protein [Nonomuraea aurantiaca]MCA2222315.1 hypothetical protein [Nonomuraea aurantiaca]